MADKKPHVKATQTNSFFREPGVAEVISSLICILGGLFVGFIVLLLISLFNKDLTIFDSVKGIFTVLKGPFGAGNFKDVLFQIGNMLFQSAPLIMTGLSVSIAFKTGLFNIGAPGQYLMGAMGSLIVALSIPTDVVPAWIVWILAFFAGTLLGVLWGAIPGFFKAVFNVNEVIVCIMTNWIAANVVSWIFSATKDNFVNYAETKINFIKKTSTNGVATATLGLDKLFNDSYLDLSIMIATAIAILLYVVMNKTTFGYELKACGFNKNAAKYAGMNEKKNIVLSMAIAGGLAACGAALWCLNGSQDFKWNTYMTLPADGFNGIPAALLANNNPIGVIFSAIFLKYLGMGGSNLSAQSSFNEYVSPLIVAVIIYFSGFSKFFKDLIHKIGRTPPPRNSGLSPEDEDPALTQEKAPDTPEIAPENVTTAEGGEEA